MPDYWPAGPGAWPPAQGHRGSRRTGLSGRRIAIGEGYLSDRVVDQLVGNTDEIGDTGAERVCAGVSVVRRTRTSRRGVAQLREDLSGRDYAIISQVADLRLMTTRQIETVHFPVENHRSALSAARAARRVLERLTDDGLLVRLERRIGGVRAGSASYVYGLGPVGHRVLDMSGARRRYYRQPTELFADHTLAISELVVALTLSARSGRCQLLTCQSEPRCWRDFTSTSGLTTLKPDLFVALGLGDFEDRFFIEVDRGTEHLPALLRKCRVYDAYYKSGIEQEHHDVFPRVCLVVPSPDRAERLTKAIDNERRLEPKLFVVTTTDRTLDTLIGEGS